MLALVEQDYVPSGLQLSCLDLQCEISLPVTTARNDEFFMRSALREGRIGIGQTSPNPAVGAVLVIDGKVVAKGHHKRAGAPHAEVECIRSFKKPIPRSAILYVTLEPCNLGVTVWPNF